MSTLEMNDLHPAEGARKRPVRVGRGIGSGSGKTAGRGHKGQRARSGSGGYNGFEGGQMPLQRRLPKFGFKSRKARFNDELRLDTLAEIDADPVDLDALIEAGVVGRNTRVVKIIASGKLDKAVNVSGLKVSKGARRALESAGGRIVD
ncbi:MAG: 50S ribosomal protein L15 [Gammaproteobacteria bacterium]